MAAFAIVIVTRFYVRWIGLLLFWRVVYVYDTTLINDHDQTNYV